MPAKTRNVVIAGLGGQGILKSSDILADALFLAGYDVKKSELHGMSQRGGSVRSDVRFGERVDSPMVPPGEADYLLLQAPDQLEVHRASLRADGTLISAEAVDAKALANRKSLNVAMLGALSRHLDVADDHWREAIARNLPAEVLEANWQAFAVGREAR